MGPPGSLGAKKIIFFKVVPRSLGMLKQLFLGRFELVVTRFGPWKIPKCLENGSFQDQKWVQNGAKTHFSKSNPRPFWMLKQLFSGRFELVVTRSGPWKIPKWLENGLFWDQKWVQNGSKTHFSKKDPRPFGMRKQLFGAHIEPVGTHFGPCQIPKCLEKAPFWDQKWVKNGSKTCFSKSDPGQFGMLKQMVLAHFEPNLTQFSPFHQRYAPSCALRAYLGAVWCSHVDLRRGV